MAGGKRPKSPYKQVKGGTSTDERMSEDSYGPAGWTPRDVPLKGGGGKKPVAVKRGK